MYLEKTFLFKPFSIYGVFFLPFFREVVRRTTVILFTNEEDYIIAGNKGGEVYRFVEQYVQLCQILRETVGFVFLRVCF